MALSVAAGVPAAAQSQQPGGNPFAGLFKGSPKEQPHTLDVKGSAFGSWGDSLPGAQPPGNFTDPSSAQGLGIADGFQGSISYGFRRAGTRSSFHFAGDVGGQQFASQRNEPVRFFSYSASTGLTTRLSTKTSVSFGAASAFAPFYQYAPFLKSTASEESPVGSDYGFAVHSTMVRSTTASLSLQNQFSKRSTISAGINWNQQVTPTDNATLILPGVPDAPAIPVSGDISVDARSAQVLFSHNLTRKLSFHVGYAIQESSYLSRADTEPVRSDSLDIGLGYGDGLTLSLGRRTTLSLAIGASIAKNGDPASVAATGKNTAFVVTGGATLSRSLGRAWGTSLAYLRNTSYVVGFSEPVMTDAVNAGVGGPLVNRLQFSAGAGASRGQQLFSGSSGGSMVSYNASTRLTYAMFTYLGLYGQASYYRYSIPADFYNTLGIVPNLNRRSVSVGLTTWFPFIKQRRARQNPADQTTTGQL